MSIRATRDKETFPEVDRVCPHCHRETEIPRSAGPVVAGGLRLEEFQALVRNEWRRRLGPESYGRAHSDRIAGALALFASNPDSAALRERLEEEVWCAAADILATGAGRKEVRREMAKLLHAIRAVLGDRGVDVRTACETYLEPGRAVIAEILDYPDPPTHDRPSAGDNGHDA